MSDGDWNIVIDVHLKGSYLCAQTFARQLKLQNKGGRIINTTSVSGLLGNFGQANYSAAKAGIYGLTRTLSIELRKANVTVNAIAPVALRASTEDLPMISAMPNAKEFLAPDTRAGRPLPGQRSFGRHHRHHRRRAGTQGFDLSDARDARRNAQGGPLDRTRARERWSEIGK